MMMVKFRIAAFFLILMAVMFAGCSSDDNNSTHKYSVTYEGNGNTGGSPPQDTTTYASSFSVTVLDKGSLVKNGYTFAGWNTQANGSGTNRAAGSTFVMENADVVLWAVWTVNPTYSVTYNANGATGTVPADSNSYLAGANVTVLDKGTLAKEGYTFSNWNTQANGTGASRFPASTFVMGSANVTLYAQWLAETVLGYSVTYNANGGTGTVPTDCNSYNCGDTVTVKANVNLIRTGYNFSGWNTLASGSGTDRAPLSTFAMTAGDLVLYAKWTPWTCGDGIVTTGEACDDGNTSNTDACVNSCANATCGDGYVWSGHEACDDGNSVNTDACLNNCTLPVCGDGYVWSGHEECDDNNSVDTDACRNNCILPYCGDGFVSTGIGEECDDDNSVNTDACLNTCKNNVCGDGYVYSGVEECDDGANNGGPGSSCDVDCNIID